VARSGFDTENAVVALLGGGEPELVGSEYLAYRHGLRGDRPPRLNLHAERDLSRLCVDLVEAGVCSVAHDVSDGGVAVALAEMCLAGRGIGCRVELPRVGRLDTTLFGESGDRIVLGLEPAVVAEVERLARAAGVPFTVIGQTHGDRLSIGVREPDAGKRADAINLALADLRARREATLPAIAAGLWNRSVKAA
jgi:phosphoribosylformylglycinamidine synthase